MQNEDLITQFKDMMWRIARSHERNAAMAEELYQDVCFAVWRSRSRIADAKNPRAYVARIANNLAISHVRRETRDQSVEQSAHEISDPDSAAVDEAVDHLHQQTQLLAAVQELPLNWRLPITLTLEGFKPAEIAFVMGTNANSVSMRLSRAKKALRERLQSTSTSTEQGRAYDQE